eukprot:1182567-Prorocentrum_minimum.AAC.2
MNDLYVGAQLVIHGRLFELLDADRYTLKYMASQPSLFWRSDPARVLQALKSELGVGAGGLGGEEVADTLRQALVDADAAGTGQVQALQSVATVGRYSRSVGRTVERKHSRASDDEWTPRQAESPRDGLAPRCRPCLSPLLAALSRLSRLSPYASLPRVRRCRLSPSLPRAGVAVSPLSLPLFLPLSSSLALRLSPPSLLQVSLSIDSPGVAVASRRTLSTLSPLSPYASLPRVLLSPLSLPLSLPLSSSRLSPHSPDFLASPLQVSLGDLERALDGVGCAVGPQAVLTLGSYVNSAFDPANQDMSRVRSECVLEAAEEGGKRAPVIGHRGGSRGKGRRVALVIREGGGGGGALRRSKGRGVVERGVR